MFSSEQFPFQKGVFCMFVRNSVHVLGWTCVVITDIPRSLLLPPLGRHMNYPYALILTVKIILKNYFWAWWQLCFYALKFVTWMYVSWRLTVFFCKVRLTWLTLFLNKAIVGEYIKFNAYSSRSKWKTSMSRNEWKPHLLAEVKRL